ncbi:MAG: hypothetical protein ACR2M7_05850, partial [Bdellovibrionales bacterium]
SPLSFSMTLGEGVAATGIQSTLNSTASSNAIATKKRAETLLKKAQQQRSLANDPLSSENLEQQLNDGGIAIQADRVDYTKSTVIFYKNNCNHMAHQNCTAVPVLTNIKSVIFDYAHNRGEFQQRKN